MILAAAAVAAATAVAQPVAAHRATGRPAARHGSAAMVVQQLVRWRKVGYWSHAMHSIPVHARPTTASPTVGKLRKLTEVGLPEVYLVLARTVRRDGRTWLKIAVPKRPNGTTGWVVRGALGGLRRVTTWLVVDRARLRARFYDHGRRLWSAPVGIGKPSTPTPAGLFWVTEEFDVRNQPFFGPYAFGTSAYAFVSDWPGGGVVGLHGTSLPQLVPGRPSHGCIRMRNRDVLWLAVHMPIGTPIAVIH